MLYFNSCPRCKTGTIEYTTDMWGKYLSCLMCGYAIHSKSIRPDSTATISESLEHRPSLAGVAVAAEADEDDEFDEVDDDLDYIEVSDEADEDSSPARVAFG